jgi:phosphoglycerol transferase MdoB-like AlkP superfamily enzyme
MQLRKILSILLVVLFVVSAVILVMFYANVVPLGSETEQMQHGVTDTFLGWGVLLFIVCAVAAVAFPVIEFVKQSIDNPKSSIKTLVIAVVIAVICVIAYSMSSGAMDSITPTLVATDEDTLKWSGAGLNTLYIALGLSIIAVIYAEVAKKFN